MGKGDKEMKLVFNMDGVICTEEVPELYKWAQPLLNVTEFMQWLKRNGHEITIWCDRPNDLAVKFATEQWLDFDQVPYNRLIFDKPSNPIYVTETPCNTKYFGHLGDNSIVSMLFEEWKEWITKKEQE